MKYSRIVVAVLLVATSLASCDKGHEEIDMVVFQLENVTQDKLNSFRDLIGQPLNEVTGVQGGRREVNWDGVPDAILGQPLPSDFFNPASDGAPVGRQRGLAYMSAGEFRVSKTGFTEVNQEAGTQLFPFSGSKLFANISSNDWEIEFQVPGATTEASVQGFGAIFADVDLPNSVRLEFFNGDRSLGKFFVPAHDEGTTHSFLGVYFRKNERITRVTVSHATKLADGQKDVSNGGNADLMALDDFLYSEPIAR